MKSTKIVLYVLITFMLLGSMFGSADAQKPPTDSLTVALSSFSEETFLPWNGSMPRHTYMLSYDCLTYVDPKTEQIMPGLATKWEMSADAKTYTFWIRKGVYFHEGWGELTAEDVKYSLERVTDPKSIGAGGSTMRALIEKIEVLEPYKLVIYLKSPYPGFVGTWLTDANSAGPVLCKKYVETIGDEKANAHPIGTGPYTLAEEHKKGGPIKLVTIPGVEKHWRVTPEFKTITFLCVPELATRVAMLKTGEVDLAPISYDFIDTIKASGLRVVSIPKSWTPMIKFGGLVTTDPNRYNPANPWAKKEVRQALNYAVDKEAICKNIFKGEAVPTGSDVPVALFMDIPPYPYDPAKAKQLLAAAGYPNGFPLTLNTCTTVPGAELPTVGEAVAMYWKAVGIDVKIVPTDWGSISDKVIGRKANDFLYTHRNPGLIVPGTPIEMTYGVESVYCAYATSESQDKLNKIRKELDPKRRDQLYKEMAQFLREEAAIIFLVLANEPYGASKKVGNWPTIRARPQNIDMITHP